MTKKKCLILLFFQINQSLLMLLNFEYSYGDECSNDSAFLFYESINSPSDNYCLSPPIDRTLAVISKLSFSNIFKLVIGLSHGTRMQCRSFSMLEGHFQQNKWVHIARGLSTGHCNIRRFISFITNFYLNSATRSFTKIKKVKSVCFSK